MTFQKTCSTLFLGLTLLLPSAQAGDLLDPIFNTIAQVTAKVIGESISRATFSVLSSKLEDFDRYHRLNDAQRNVEINKDMRILLGLDNGTSNSKNYTSLCYAFCDAPTNNYGAFKNTSLYSALAEELDEGKLQAMYSALNARQSLLEIRAALGISGKIAKISKNAGWLADKFSKNPRTNAIITTINDIIMGEIKSLEDLKARAQTKLKSSDTLL